MEPAYVDGWWNELKKYWSKIEIETKLSLQQIKQERIRNGLLFDEKFKSSFLRTTYSKIGDTFEQFLKDEQRMEMLLSTTHSQRRDNKSDRDGDLPTIRNDSNAQHPELIDLISDDDGKPVCDGLNGLSENREISVMDAELNTTTSMSENDDFLYYNYASGSEDDNEFNDFDMIEPTNAPSTMEFDLRAEEQVSNDAKGLDLTKTAGADENFGHKIKCPIKT